MLVNFSKKMDLTERTIDLSEEETDCERERERERERAGEDV